MFHAVGILEGHNHRGETEGPRATDGYNLFSRDDVLEVVEACNHRERKPRCHPEQVFCDDETKAVTCPALHANEVKSNNRKRFSTRQKSPNLASPTRLRNVKKF